MDIQQLEELLETTPADHPERPGRLLSLAIEYRKRYRLKGAESDLKMFIQKVQESLSLTPEGHPERARRIQALGVAYRDKYRLKGTELDLNMFIQKIQESLSLTPENHPERARRFDNLGIGYCDRYRLKGAESDLNMAIQYFQESLHLTPEDHPERARRLEGLGVTYRDKYRLKGAESDLNIFIQKVQESLRLTPEHHPERARQLVNLGVGYRDRYRLKGAESDLNASIQHIQESLHLLPENYLEQARQHENLGVGYGDKYQLKGTESDLNTSIQHFQESLRLTPKDYSERASRLQNLGDGYRDRYRLKGDESDLNTAIQYLQEALSITPEYHLERAQRFQSLGIGYRDKYRLRGAELDLHISIQYIYESLHLTPEDHRERARRLHNLGIGYRDRYRVKGAESDLNLSIQQFQESLDQHLSPPLVRLRSGTALLELYAETQNWSLAHQASSTAVSLIPLLTPRSLENSDKQNALLEVVGLASNAAALALMAGKSPYEAIQLLELGRGVIISSLNEMRADIHDLQQQHPKLADEYLHLRNQLDAPTTSIRPAHEPNTLNVDLRYNAAQKLEQMIENIRKLPGFERFLLAPIEDELKAAAAAGPVVVINLSDYRCDAFIIEKHGLQALPLPHLESNDVRARAATLANPDVLDTSLLEWLWDTIAKPVLDTLGFTEIPDDSWPRVWWIPTGPLTKFPIHAAGSRDFSVLDRVISSYSASIRALIQSRQRRSKAKVAPEEGKAIFVGMEKTPNHKHLPYVPQEIEILSKLCGSTKLQVTRPQTHRSNVLSALQDCKIFHFAGHGLTDQEDPSKSSLILSDGLLAVSSLFDLNLHNRAPFLAYLSACGTGEMKQDSLIDEALHLISACQLAGFQHVIGTLWKVKDQTCVEAAAKTYEWMIGGNMSDDSVAEGLHTASRHLRAQWISESAVRTAARTSERLAGVHIEDGALITEQARSSQGTTRHPRTVELYEDPPLYWVPYVHFGI